jgi:hypothetical protein
MINMENFIKKTAKAEGKVILKKGKRLVNIDINLQ